MKLYYSPGTCSLAPRIALIEAGLPFEGVAVDLRQRTVEDGRSLKEVNAKGYLPVLELDDGRRYTESVAVLDWIAARCPSLGVPGEDGRTRLIEMLSYLSSELHVAFKPFWHSGSDADKAVAGKAVAARLELLENHINELYLFGPRFTVADAYLFVMLRWARAFGVPLSARLFGYFERVLEHASVRRAVAEEGLTEEALPVAMHA